MMHSWQSRLWCLVVLTVRVLGGEPGVPLLTEEGFRIPQPGAILQFPRDHGSHPDFKIEWWYLTGHLQEASGRRYGFQATFFRLAGPAVKDTPVFSPAFGDRHLHLGHMAWTEVDGGRYVCEERLGRDGWDAGASTEGLRVWQGDWLLEMTDPASEQMRLQASVQGEIRWQFSLRPVKPLVRFGADGTSRKGADPSARSYYLSFTRLQGEGTFQEGGRAPVVVSGEVWMDHEIASQQLGRELAGWDWTAIQLRDGSEIKAYLLRRPDGTPDPYSAFYWISPAGEVQQCDSGQFRWRKIREWKSPQTGVRYPVEVELSFPALPNGLSWLRLVPRFDGQEFRGKSGSLAYWEGACGVWDAEGREIGQAYLELVGYGTSVADRLR